MMKVIKGFLALALPLLLLAAANTGWAQSDQGNSARVFGLGQPASVQDLPPGQLKRSLESLPPQARTHALHWLQEFSFPETDLETLHVDNEGNVFYGDTLLPDPERMDDAQAEGAPGTGSAPSTTLDDAFLLHSKPGAPNVVYIDFDGHTITGTAWNGTYPVLEAVPYNPTVSPSEDPCNDPETFCDAERTAIVDIWHRVAEDLAPYDIDVTTEEPAVFTPTTGRILVTHTNDASGYLINCSSCGGVAYVNVFGRSSQPYDYAYYSPALVFFNKLGNGTSTYNAEASSHEFGHNLGLSHDGAAGTAYYQGQGSGLVSWAPIMGNSYYNNVTQWSNGDYAGANQTQDDLAIIDGKLGYSADDHGNDTGSATPLFIDGSGQILSSNPELDPHNFLTENKGVIHSASDVDVFSFVSGAGTMSLTATPSWDAFYNGTARRGSNLDIEMQLQDLNGNPILTAEPTNNTNANINATVSAGTYYLQITGVGNGDPQVSGYSDYNSMGQYFINGFVPPAGADETAPLPNPLTWASVPAATGQFSIAMTASTATDETSAVQYRFYCTTSTDPNCESIGSGWQSSSSYTATGLLSDTQYTFQARARDQAGNETGSSDPASATTDAPLPPPPYVNFVASSDTPVASSNVSGAYSSTHDLDGVAQSITERESGGRKTSRYSYLEHQWNFTISAGDSVTVNLTAKSGGSTDGDIFKFEYSLNGAAYQPLPLLDVSNTSYTTMSDSLPPGSSGSVVIRVVDSNQGSNNQELNTVFVDRLFIQVGAPSVDPPIGAPGNLNASTVSSSQIHLTWDDGTENESGFIVEHTLTDPSGPSTPVWEQRADLPAGSTSYSDIGLTDETTYYYRVHAYNGNGISAFTNFANATTDVAPALSLSASGGKVKGVIHVYLSWTGFTNVDIYRDGGADPIAAGWSGTSYDDDLKIKGSGTFTHKVCVAGTQTCSNTTTTSL